MVIFRNVIPYNTKGVFRTLLNISKKFYSDIWNGPNAFELADVLCYKRVSLNVTRFSSTTNANVLKNI